MQAGRDISDLNHHGHVISVLACEVHVKSLLEALTKEYPVRVETETLGTRHTCKGRKKHQHKPRDLYEEAFLRFLPMCGNVYELNDRHQEAYQPPENVPLPRKNDNP